MSAVDIRETLALIEREADDFGDAIEAEMEAAAAAEGAEREEARRRAAGFWEILFADIEAGLAAADSTRAIYRSSIERLRALRDHFDAQLSDAERRLELVNEAVKRALIAAAAAAGQETIRIKGARVNCGLARTQPSVVVEVPAELLPRTYQRVKVEPDKKALAAALKGGQEVPGVRLEHGLRVDWRGA